MSGESNFNASCIVLEDDDIGYEEELIRNPYNLKSWLRYLEHKRSSPDYIIINTIYERALKQLPGSYKLWYNYLNLRVNQLKGVVPDGRRYEEVNNAFERSLTYMHKMPRIWLSYLDFLMCQGFVTRTRRVLNRALRSLPITQHARLWKPFLTYLLGFPELVETVTRCYRRYLKMMPEDTEDYINFLIRVVRLDEASSLLVKIINDSSFISKHGKSKFQLWTELCELISKNPDKVTSLKVEPIIRQGLLKYTDQVGVLWNALSEYYIRSQLFERARDIYEEAIEKVMTIGDFSKVFDSYSEFMEKIIKAKTEASSELGSTEEDDLEIELYLARLEDLIERRPLLLNSVHLRQNPNNVLEWQKRVKLYEGNPKEMIATYTEALQTVEAKKVSGKFYKLWVEFAQLYENANQLDDARMLLERGMNVDFRNVDELASLVCEYAEMELRNRNKDRARKILQKAVVPVAGIVDYHDSAMPVQHRLCKSLKLWSFYVDLEESLDEDHLLCKSVYDRMLDLRIATPQIVKNYAEFLEDRNYFEEAFKAYEKGVALFKWPNVYEIWNAYLIKFINRYGGKKLERARDLFEQCLEGCPPKFAKPIYLLYAKLEEEHGQPRRALNIYDRATKGVLPEEMHEMFNIYLKRGAELKGLDYTREIYQQAIETLPRNAAIDMCMRFADLETKMGEIDRARAIYAHCSQMCDPRIALSFWKTWKDFEMKHGNEDTAREMLRVKKSVSAIFNTQVNFMSAQILTAQAAKRSLEGDDSMKNLEQQAKMMAMESAADRPQRMVQFVRSESTAEELHELTKTNNPEEINIAEDDEEEHDMEDEYELEQQPIPRELLGNLMPGSSE